MKKTAAAAALEVRIKAFGDVICLPQKWAAKFLKVTPQRFRQFEIPPYRIVGRAPWYALDDLAALAAERSAPRSPDPQISADAAERLKELKVEEAELDLAERRGELVHFSAVQGALDAVLHESNARFGAIPHAIADEVMSATARERVVHIIETAINGARELFANLRIPLTGPARMGTERGGREAGPTANDGRGVGGPEPRSIS